MKVSWKQSSASVRPTAATRKRHTSSRWSSRKRWKGGSTAIQRPCRLVRESQDLQAKPRRGAVALLAGEAVQAVEHAQDLRRPDRVHPRERPARMVHPELHPGVDVAGARDPLLHGEARLVDHLADHPPDHAADAIGDVDHRPPEPLEELPREIRAVDMHP